MTLDDENKKTEVSTPVQTMMAIYNYAPRIAKALLRYAIERKFGKASRSALELYRVIMAKSWEDTSNVFRQIDTVGPKSIKALGNRGISSISRLLETDRLELEAAFKRTSDFVYQVIKQVKALPRFHVSIVEESLDRAKDMLHLRVTIKPLSKDMNLEGKTKRKGFQTGYNISALFLLDEVAGCTTVVEYNTDLDESVYPEVLEPEESTPEPPGSLEDEEHSETGEDILPNGNTGLPAKSTKKKQVTEKSTDNIKMAATRKGIYRSPSPESRIGKDKPPYNKRDDITANVIEELTGSPAAHKLSSSSEEIIDCTVPRSKIRTTNLDIVISMQGDSTSTDHLRDEYVIEPTHIDELGTNEYESVREDSPEIESVNDKSHSPVRAYEHPFHMNEKTPIHRTEEAIPTSPHQRTNTHGPKTSAANVDIDDFDIDQVLWGTDNETRKRKVSRDVQHNETSQTHYPLFDFQSDDPSKRTRYDHDSPTVTFADAGLYLHDGEVAEYDPPYDSGVPLMESNYYEGIHAEPNQAYTSLEAQAGPSSTYWQNDTTQDSQVLPHISSDDWDEYAGSGVEIVD
ncbi:hypothetical protein CI109_101472 [Kwoniella shandongensis]|uniref:SEC63 domain-containing protein n=1 Tax=Kwoniella shandongensis TaxID=1734106 RepID=A0AAJ8MUZ1_9TREE